MRLPRSSISIFTAVSLIVQSLVVMTAFPSPAYAITLGEAQAASGRIGAGTFHSLARTADSTVIAWGDNGEGQTALSGMANVTKVAAGADHSLALKSDGTVVASGLDSYGQCQVPPTLTGVISIAAGEEHSLALRSNGTVAAWGANTFGQSTVPAGLTGVVAIAAGGYHSLALKSDGKVVAWGANGSGQSTVPSTLTNVVAIAAGGFHSLALRSDGTITGWGRNNEAQRIPPSGLSGVVAISAGWRHSLALKSDGTVVAWGGGGVESSIAVPPGLNDVVAISAGWRHSLALRSDGTPVGWGLNESAQCLGPVSINPAPNSKNIPIDTVFRIVYSAPVKAGDAYSQITLEDSQGSPVASTRTISGTLLTVTPSVALKTDERYVLRVPAGSLKDDFNTSVIGVTYLFDTLDTVPPVVASVVPAHGATGVLPGYGTDVRVTFSESIVLGNNADAIVLSGPQGPVARTVGISLGALRIIPVDGLAPETTYTLTVPAGTVTDLAGNALVTTFASSFTTGAADTTPPVVVSVSPTNGATGVLNTISAVRVTMSEPVLPGPAFFDITLRDTAGNPVEIHRWRDGNVLNVSPVDLLAPQTTYTLNVPAGAVTDLSGNALTTSFTSSFTTGGADATPPTVSSVSPVHGATGVAPGPLTIGVTFSENVVQGTNFSAIGLRNQAGVFVDRTLSLSGKVLSITPIEGVQPGTSYTVVIPVGAVKDLSGNALATSFTSSFTTAVIDTTPPVVISVSPANGAVNVSPGSLTIRVTFSEPIIQGAVFQNVVLTGSGGAPVGRTLAVSGSALLITPTGGVAPLTTYTITVPAGAVADVSGNALATSFTSSFTTASDAAPVTAERIAGQDRIMTAVEVSKDTFTAASTVVISTAFNFPDA
ncbi:MAG: Ig-like domain-containing protein, partial [Coriobacteriia bacterium]|nr:Ig-like domain-containing protein [Coriobacteriia bacterium]